MEYITKDRWNYYVWLDNYEEFMKFITDVGYSLKDLAFAGKRGSKFKYKYMDATVSLTNNRKLPKRTHGWFIVKIRRTPELDVIIDWCFPNHIKTTRSFLK